MYLPIRIAPEHACARSVDADVSFWQGSLAREEECTEFRADFWRACTRPQLDVRV